jgi:hypothetical protein
MGRQLRAQARRLNELGRTLADRQREVSQGNKMTARQRRALQQRAKRLARAINRTQKIVGQMASTTAPVSLTRSTRQILQASLQLANRLAGQKQQALDQAPGQPPGQNGAERLQAMQRTATRSARTMRKLARRWQTAASGQPARATEPAADPAGRARRADAGTFREQAGPSQGSALPGGYQMRTVPTRYRPLVRQYFQRLNSDQPDTPNTPKPSSTPPARPESPR